MLRAIVSAGPLSSFQFPSINISSSRVRVRDSSRHCPPKIVSYQQPAPSRPRNSSYPQENSLNRRPWKISSHIYIPRLEPSNSASMVVLRASRHRTRYILLTSREMNPPRHDRLTRSHCPNKIRPRISEFDIDGSLLPSWIPVEDEFKIIGSR